MKAFLNEYFLGERAYLTYWYAFLLSLPFSWRKVIVPAVSGGNFNEYMDISIYIGDILILCTLLIILKHESNRKSIFSLLQLFHVEQIFILLLITYLGISIFWSQSIPLLFDGIIAFIRIITIVAISIFILIRNNYQVNCSTWNNLKYFTFIFSLILVFQSFIGITQFITNHSIGLFFLGESNINQYIAGVAKINFDQYRQIRSYGTFLHPNIFAGYTAIGILFILFYIKKSYKLFHVEQYYYRSVLILLILSLFTTFSKSAIVSLMVSIPLLLFHVEQFPVNGVRVIKNTPLNIRKIVSKLFHVEQLAFLSIILVFILVIFISGHDQINKSIDERIAINKYYGINIQDALFGQGIGQSVYGLWKKNTALEYWQYQPIHNVYLQSIIELGIIGSGILIMITISFLRKIVPRGTIVPQLAVLTCLGTLAMFDHYLWDIYTGQVLLALSLGWAYSVTNGSIDKNT